MTFRAYDADTTVTIFFINQYGETTYRRISITDDKCYNLICRIYFKKGLFSRTVTNVYGQKIDYIFPQK